MELKKKEFLTHLTERGYLRDLVETILAEVHFESRTVALQDKPKTSKKILPFVRTFNLATPILKKILIKHYHLVTGKKHSLKYILTPPMLLIARKRSVIDFLVRVNISSL